MGVEDDYEVLPKPGLVAVLIPEELWRVAKNQLGKDGDVEAFIMATLALSLGPGPFGSSTSRAFSDRMVAAYRAAKEDQC